MAPVEQRQQGELMVLRGNIYHGIVVRDGGSGGPATGGGGGGDSGNGASGSNGGGSNGGVGSSSNSNSSSRSGSGGNNGDVGGGKNGVDNESDLPQDDNDDKNRNNGNDNDGRKSGSSSDDDRPKQTNSLPSTPSETTTTASTTIPTTIVITSIAAAPSAALSQEPTSTSPLITSAPSIPPPVFTFPPDSSTQPRKGLGTESGIAETSSSTTTPSSSSGSNSGSIPSLTSSTSSSTTSFSTTKSRRPKSSTSSTSTFPIPESVLAPAATNFALPADTTLQSQSEDNSISPLAEHLLIAAGAIGAFIIIVATIYFMMRMKQKNMFACFRNRKASNGVPRGWPGWRRRGSDMASFEPERLSDIDYGYPSDEKLVQRPGESFFNPIAKPILAIPPNATPASINTSEQKEIDSRQQPLIVTPQQEAKPVEQAFYTNEYNTYNTNGTYFTQNTSNLQYPNQTDINHLSYLSSLSSGFGDAEINIPESGPTKLNPQEFRQSSHQSRKFSWVSSVPGFRRQGDRDTVYTTASEDSAPRFRTITSWVAQQTGRVERKQQIDSEIPDMPSLPRPLQIGVDQDDNNRTVFQYHPGDEVQISRGSRVPSEILDRKIGLR